MTTGYAQNILPLFRVACMTPRGVRIGDTQWMCDPAANGGFDDHGNARRVFAAVSSGFMPPGARWPQHRLDLYSSWMTEGFQP